MKSRASKVPHAKRKLYPNHGRAWSDQDLKFLVELGNCEYFLPELSKILGRAPKSIQERLEKINGAMENKSPTHLIAQGLHNEQQSVDYLFNFHWVPVMSAEDAEFDIFGSITKYMCNRYGKAEIYRWSALDSVSQRRWVIYVGESEHFVPRRLIEYYKRTDSSTPSGRVYLEIMRRLNMGEKICLDVLTFDCYVPQTGQRIGIQLYNQSLRRYIEMVHIRATIKHQGEMVNISKGEKSIAYPNLLLNNSNNDQRTSMVLKPEDITKFPDLETYLRRFHKKHRQMSRSCSVGGSRRARFHV